MKFLARPNHAEGRCGGIYYGDHHLGRFTRGNIAIDWIDRTDDRGYRFYQTGPSASHSLNIMLPREKEPANHLKIIVKSNGEQIVVAKNDIWKIPNASLVQLLDKPYLGFWAWNNNHLRISNFVIRPYTGEKRKNRKC